MNYRLVLDFGNTACKAALFRDGELFEHAIIEGPALEHILAFAGGKPVEAAILAAVVVLPENLIADLNTFFPTLHLGPETALPIGNHYATPETLGYDRLAAAVAAWQLFPNVPVLAMTVGTCITYNIVSAEGHFLGGAIAPGIYMRFRALHAFTQGLPLVVPEGENPLLGTSTETSIRAGVLQAVQAEVSGLITQYESHFPGLKTIAGGGDAMYLANALKNGIFARPMLVAEGLNRILEHHVANRLLQI
ncbi:MAG: type III pantothenate kinase [Bacteroidia bacterium]